MVENSKGDPLALSEAVEFLWSLPTEKAHVCAIHPTQPGKIRGRTFEKTADNRSAAAKWLASAQASGFGCYFYINDLSVTLGPNKPKAEEAEVSRMNALHVDADVPKATPPDKIADAKSDLLAKARAYDLPPSIVVDSGGGFGLFAMLANPVKVTDANRDDLKRRNKKFALDICGPDADPCWNLDRVMRLPFTINYPSATKIRRGRTAVPATLIDDATAFILYEVGQFRPVIDVIAKTIEEAEFDGPSDATIEQLNLPKKLAAVIRTGDHGKSERTTDRSKGAFHIMCELIRADVSNDDILALAVDPDHLGFAHLHDPQHAPRGVLETAERMLREALNRQPRESGNWLGDDLYAYLPEHAYIYVPTRALWPASSINSLLGSGASEKLDNTRAVQQMTWAPGLPMLVKDRLIVEGGWTDKEGATCFNLYLAPKIRERGNATEAGPWRDHLYTIYPDEAGHIEKWLASRVQRPDLKINHSLVLGSGSHGIGKDTLLEPIKHAIGPWNFRDVSAEQVLGDFNPFLKSVVLRISEARDLGDKDRFAFYDHTKTWMAAPPDVLSVADKYIRAHPVFNCTGIIITTNHKTDGLYLPAEDRRHFVAWTEIEPGAFDAGYWNRLWNWYDDGGLDHVAAYLADLDLSDFDPKAPPLKTLAFWEIVNVNRSPEDAELADVLDRLGADPLGEDEVERPVAVTIAEIAREAARDGADGFYQWIMDRKNRRHLPHRMEQCGYVPVRNDAAKDGLWAINGKRQVIYGASASSPRDRLKAAAVRVSAAERRAVRAKRR
jgi:hypothetical protein